MEKVNLQVLDAIVELAEEKFSEQFATLATNFTSETFDKDLMKYLDEFKTYSVNKLEVFNPNFKNLPLYLNYIFSSFLKNQTSDDNQIFIEVLNSFYEKNTLKSFVTDLLIQYQDDNKFSTKLIDFSYKFEIKSILEELQLIYFNFISENYLEENLIGEELAVEGFSKEVFRVINEKFNDNAEEELKHVCILDIICSFENLIVFNAPSNFSQIFHKRIWNDIVIPNKFKKSIKSHFKRIDELIFSKRLEENVLEKYGKDLLDFRKKSIKQKELKGLELLLSTIENFLRKELDGQIKLQAQQEMFKNNILAQFLSLLNGVKVEIDMSGLNKFFEPFSLSQLFSDLEPFISNMKQGFNRNMVSLSKESNETYTSEKIKDLPEYFYNYIDEYYNEFLYLIDENLKCFIFQDFYKNYYESIPRLFHFHILVQVSKLMKCHVKKIDPTENINGEYIADLIIFKARPLLSKFDESYYKLLKERLNISEKNNIQEISKLSKYFDELSKEHDAITNEMWQEIMDTITNELEIYFDDDEAKKVIATYSFNQIFYEFQNLFQINYKKTWLELLKENKMELTPQMIKSIEVKLEEIKSIKLEHIEHNNKIADLGITLKETDFINRDSLFAQDVILDNFFSDLKNINSTINKRIPHLPYLINELTAAQYIVFAFILESNLQGKLLDLTDKKIIEKIAGIAPKTAYDVYNTLLNREFLLMFENNGKQLALVNAPKIVEVAKNYYKIQLSK